MKKKIYAYYEALQAYDQNEQFARANVWKASWEENGWETVMLNRSHAQGSPLHLKLMTKLNRIMPVLPSELQNNIHFIIARLSRWCALHAAGGGWMSDYDVINKSFDADKATQLERNGSLFVLSDQPSFLFYATREICASAIQKIINDDLHVDGVLKNEDKIFNEDGKLDAILGDVCHASKTPELPKSEVMKNIFTNSENNI